jgi:hypothetical protein
MKMTKQTCIMKMQNWMCTANGRENVEWKQWSQHAKWQREDEHKDDSGITPQNDNVMRSAQWKHQTKCAKWRWWSNCREWRWQTVMIFFSCVVQHVAWWWNFFFKTLLWHVCDYFHWNANLKVHLSLNTQLD